jgi:hypothetical protein
MPQGILPFKYEMDAQGSSDDGAGWIAGVSGSGRSDGAVAVD